MNYELIWSARAKREIRAIREYVAADNPDAADRLIANIFARAEAVRHNPGIGSRFIDRKGQEGRQIVVGKYRVIYRVISDLNLVEIVTVWHGARLDPELN
jgi:plasmid stabilization system protein ParE